MLVGAAPLLGCLLTPGRSLKVLVLGEEEPVRRLGRRSKLYGDQALSSSYLYVSVRPLLGFRVGCRVGLGVQSNRGCYLAIKVWARLAVRVGLSTGLNGGPWLVEGQ